MFALLSTSSFSWSGFQEDPEQTLCVPFVVPQIASLLLKVGFFKGGPYYFAVGMSMCTTEEAIYLYFFAQDLPTIVANALLPEMYYP